MGKIQIMSDALASQVAAGEVVERPSSVLKELVENSLDAGSTQIQINLERGGISLIEIIDNGCGMDRQDALMALERHATSKLKSKDDLNAIRTLGFRGEALPSIASVSRFKMNTREHGAPSGTEITIEGGRMVNVKESGAPPGTSITIRSLFYNIPARRKFLRSENTESTHVEHQLKLQAISRQDVAFTLTRDGREIWRLPANQSLKERISGISGRELAERLIEVPKVEHNGMSVYGYIAPPGLGRSSRSLQLTFLNHRPIESPIITHALREAYHTALMKGQYPIVFLFLEMDPAEVDVNVHPAKREVRFRDGHAVRAFITEAIASALTDRRHGTSAYFGGPGEAANQNPALSHPTLHLVNAPEPLTQEFVPSAEIAPPFSFQGADSPLNENSSGASKLPQILKRSESESQARVSYPPSLDPIPQPPQAAFTSTFPHEHTPQPQAQSLPQAHPPQAPPDAPWKSYRLLGVLHKLYVLLESPEGLVMMDQHAAHERVLFEKMRAQMEAQGVPSQRLLMPVTLEVSPKDSEWILQNTEILHKLGVNIEEFGPQVLKIDALPATLKNPDPIQFIYDLLDEVKRFSSRTSPMRLGEDIVATTVCRHAIKANDVLREIEVQRLLDDLFQCEMPYCCPHGRPTLIQIGTAELEKRFGRRAP